MKTDFPAKREQKRGQKRPTAKGSGKNKTPPKSAKQNTNLLKISEFFSFLYLKILPLRFWLGWSASLPAC
jgi:hypothetical protein